MKYFLGIDGGGTKTAFLLTDVQGHVKAACKMGTTHYLQVGFDGVTNTLHQGITTCLQQANLTEANICFAFVALAGYGDIQTDCPKLQQSVANALASIPFQVGNDNENALAGSLAGKPGINIIAGTGSIGMGINEQGEHFRSGGWHHAFLGDEGSAYWIASNMLRHFSRQSDGREARTTLYNYLKTEMHWDDDSQMLSDCVVKMDYDRVQIAALAKHAYNLARQNDPVILGIYDEAAKELADMIKAIYKTLHMSHALVSYSGGVFQSGTYILTPLKKYLAGLDIELVKPILSPDKGSILLAMKAAGLTIQTDCITTLQHEHVSK